MVMLVIVDTGNDGYYVEVHLVQVIVLFDGLSADRRPDSRHPGVGIITS